MRFSEDEYLDMMEKVQKTHLSTGGFIRSAVKNLEMKEAPPAEYYELIREVRRIGYNINQLLKIANARGLMDAPLIRRALEDNRATERMLWRVFQEGG